MVDKFSDSRLIFSFCWGLIFLSSFFISLWMCSTPWQCCTRSLSIRLRCFSGWKSTFRGLSWWNDFDLEKSREKCYCEWGLLRVWECRRDEIAGWVVFDGGFRYYWDKDWVGWMRWWVGQTVNFPGVREGWCWSSSVNVFAVRGDVFIFVWRRRDRWLRGRWWVRCNVEVGYGWRGDFWGSRFWLGDDGEGVYVGGWDSLCKTKLILS